MDQTVARRFADHWVNAWNAHDLDAVLVHFSDYVVFSSPVAELIVPDSDGILRGKPALRAYWEAGLERMPDLHFDLLALYVGVDTLVLNYRNQRGGLVNEVLRFEGDLVVEGHGTYFSE